MGNACECVSRQTDDAEDALLAPEFDGDQPRGPPPPYQVHFLSRVCVCVCVCVCVLCPIYYLYNNMESVS
jgi:hypothetical protein